MALNYRLGSGCVGIGLLLVLGGISCGERFPQYSGTYRLQSIAVTGEPADQVAVPLPNSIEVQTRGSGSSIVPMFDLHFQFYEDRNVSFASTHRDLTRLRNVAFTESLSRISNCAQLREAPKGGDECVPPSLGLHLDQYVSLGAGCFVQFENVLTVQMTPDPQSLFSLYSSSDASAAMPRVRPLTDQEQETWSRAANFKIGFVIQKRMLRQETEGCSTPEQMNYLAQVVLHGAYEIRVTYVAVVSEDSLNPFSTEVRNRAMAWRSTHGIEDLATYFASLF